MASDIISASGTYKMSATAGGEIEIVLESNPTTGYRWEILSSDLEKVGEEYVTDPGREGLCGAGGTQRYRFLCGTTGGRSVKFVYKREWEPEPVRQVTVEITVQ